MPVRNPTLGTIQLCRETLSSMVVKDICFSLNNHGIQTLSLRECHLENKDFKKLMLSVGKCRSLAQLCLNVGVITNSEQVDMLAKALIKNKFITTLFMHGSNLSESDVLVLIKALSTHPRITSLDFGDCKLGDYAIEKVCDLLPPDGIKPGLQELSLSGNPSVTSKGWAKLAIAVVASSCLKSLYLDYNALGNYGAGVLAVATAGNSAIEVLDLECTGITDHGAKVFLHLLQSYPNRLKLLNVAGNDIKEEIIQDIATAVEHNSSEIGGAIRKERVKHKTKHFSDTEDETPRKEASRDDEEPHETSDKDTKKEHEDTKEEHEDTKEIYEKRNATVKRTESVRTENGTYDEEEMDLLAIAHELEKQRDSDDDVSPEITQNVESVPKLNLADGSDYEESDEESTEDETEEEDDGTCITDSKDIKKLTEKIAGTKVNNSKKFKNVKEDSVVAEKFQDVQEYTAQLSQMEDDDDDDDEYDSDEAEFMTEIPVTTQSNVQIIPSHIATADGSYSFHCSRYF